MLPEPSVVQAEPSTSTSEVRPLTAILNDIRVDSQQAPQAYLAETEVQHGGE